MRLSYELGLSYLLLNILLQELEERYNRLRLEFQLAVDKAEAVPEAELVRRALSKEKGNALTKGFFGATNRCACHPLAVFYKK